MEIFNRGLGGVVQFNRSNPTERTNIQVGLSALSGAQNGIDFASTGDYLNHRVSLRYAQGTPFRMVKTKHLKTAIIIRIIIILG